MEKFTMPSNASSTPVPHVEPPAASHVEPPAASHVAPAEPVQSTLTLAEKMPTARPRAFYVASMWHITPASGVDMIEAVNNQTGDRYEGSIIDFNDMLHGN